MRDDYRLIFEKNLPRVQAEVREFSAMKNYLQDPASHYHRRDVYHIYRDVARPEHAEQIHASNLEYDLTVIPPGKIGNEFVKTIGHYHPYKPGTKIRYPEVYEVIFGKVFLFLQSASEDFERLEEVFLVTASRGEKILVPPGFGHVSINPSGDVLVLANWQPLGNEGIYEPYETHNGAAYYVTQRERLSASGQTTPEFEFLPNLAYQKVPPLKKVSVRELPQYDLLSALPMYFTGTRNLGTLEFLTSPENYHDELVPEKLFSS